MRPNLSELKFTTQLVVLQVQHRVNLLFLRTEKTRLATEDTFVSSDGFQFRWHGLDICRPYSRIHHPQLIDQGARSIEERYTIRACLQGERVP